MKLAGFALGVAAFLAPAVAHALPNDTAVLQGLDKVTARTSTIDVKLGQVVRFGSLEIMVRHCDKKPPEETPESAAFLEISDVQPGEDVIELFTGWMFASSPALNALEHPVYDVWVLDCKNSASSSDAISDSVGSE